MEVNPKDIEHCVNPREDGVHLPDEIIIQILSYVAHFPYAIAKRTLTSACFLSRSWYDSAVPLLYERPSLYGRNFDPFVRTICPSKNAHVIHSPLAKLVKALDLSRLVHEGSKSTTARLIGRTKGQLEEFVAPMATFSPHCFPALSKCTQLRILDLSLVAEQPPLPDLFKTISHLDNLHTLRLPRSSGFGVHHKPSSFTWPPNLHELCLSGGIDAHFLHGIVSFPPTLRHLAIENCPSAKTHAVTHLLRKIVRPLPNLESLRIAHMPRISRYALDNVLLFLPQLKSLSVSTDYVSDAVFDPAHYHHADVYDEDPPLINTQGQVVLGPNLRSFELTASGSSHMLEDKLTPIDITNAIVDNTLPKLRQVRVARELGWDGPGFRDDLEGLVGVLQDATREDWAKCELVSEITKSDTHSNEGWKDNAGVWIVDGR